MLRFLMSSHIHNLFFVASEKIRTGEIEISGQEYHHFKNVLRKNIGDVVYVTDGKGHRYKTEILKIERRKVLSKILAQEYIEPGKFGLSLAFVPIKGWRNDFIIEKGTELGVRSFFLFASKHAVVTNLSSTKIDRLKKIALSAMLQSQQYYLPEISFHKDLNGLIAQFENYDCVLLADKHGKTEVPQNAKSVLYIVGPEGGFDPDEVALFERNSAQLIALGKNRLRSETAAITGIVKILAAYGEI